MGRHPVYHHSCYGGSLCGKCLKELEEKEGLGSGEAGARLMR